MHRSVVRLSTRLARAAHVAAKPSVAVRRPVTVSRLVPLKAQSSLSALAARPRAYNVARIPLGGGGHHAAKVEEAIPGADDKDMKAHVGKYLNRELKPSQRPDDPEDYFYVRSKAQLAAGNVQEAYGVHPDAGALGQAGAIAKYGVIPTVGLALATAISKELFILDEEVLIVACFATFIGSVYVTQGQAIKEAVEVQVATVRHNMEAYYDALIDTMVAQIQFYEENYAMKEEILELYNCFKETNAKFIATRKNVLVKALNEAVEKELEHLAELEAKKLDDAAIKVANDSREYVEKKVMGSPQLREAYLKASIQLVSQLGSSSSGTSALVDDPLGPLYKEYMELLRKDVATKKANGITLSDAKFQEAQEWAEKKSAFLNTEPDVSHLKNEFPEEARILVQPALDHMIAQRKAARPKFQIEVSRVMPFHW